MTFDYDSQPPAASERAQGDRLGRVGVVVIGRNEAPRLAACLDSVSSAVAGVTYVDSGSADDSLAIAKRHEVDVVALSPGQRFSAARARNAGFERLLELSPEIDKVQFIDGDCAFVPGWLEAGARTLDERPDVVAVAGRLHERHPERSVYNRLCELEWARVPPGAVRAFGGIVMIRAESLRRAGGWHPGVIAAEDDELSIRLRQAGGRILRLADSMAHHDAAITRFGQWWRRAVRSGHAYAQVAELHRKSSEKYFVRETSRALFWGLVLPAASGLGVVPTAGASLLLTVAYPAQVFRLFVSGTKRGLETEDALLLAVTSVVSRFAEVRGIFAYLGNRLLRREARIIEYKGALQHD